MALARWLAKQPRYEGGPLGKTRLSPIAQALSDLDEQHAATEAEQTT